MNVSDNEFVCEVVTLYPDLKEEFDELDGLIHLQMDRFRYRMEEDMKERNEEKVLCSYILAEKCYRYGGEALKNAVDTSFAEAVFSGHDKETIAWGWQLMPPVLKKLYVVFWGQNAI